VVALALGGCSVSEFLPTLTPDEIAGPEPHYRFLIAGALKGILGDPAQAGPLQISGVRRVDGFKGPSWLVCLKVQPSQVALPRYYAVFLQREQVVDSRLSVLVDQCELQAYTPFDGAAEEKRPPR